MILLLRRIVRIIGKEVDIFPAIERHQDAQRSLEAGPEDDITPAVHQIRLLYAGRNFIQEVMCHEIQPIPMPNFNQLMLFEPGEPLHSLQ